MQVALQDESNVGAGLVPPLSQTEEQEMPDTLLNIQPLTSPQKTSPRESITITLAPKLYPLKIVLLAAYELVSKKLAICIEGDPGKEIQVRLSSGHQEASFDEWGQLFQQKLMEVTLKEHQWEQKADIRGYLLTAAISYDEALVDPPPDLLCRDEEEKCVRKLTFTLTEDNTGNLLCLIDIGRVGLTQALPKILQVADQLKECCHFFPQSMEEAQILCKVVPINKVEISTVKSRICAEFECFNRS